ncbi:MAG: hypothetical protein QOF72_866 [Blastocatellia bacterium]|jgi:nitrogen fixation negative regulator NifL|nr:hypothetical protein [Blastocatellia bacterium]MDX6575958.1 hypothetical protein [Blastocatellia bacterium]
MSTAVSNRLFDSSILGSNEDALDFLTNVLQSSVEYSIVCKGLDGTILLWNEGARRLYGYEPEEVVGRANSSILHTPEDVEAGKPRKMLDAALKDGKWEGTMVRVRKNGAHFTARIVLTPRRDSAGDVTGFLLISKDITEEIRREEQMRLQSLVLDSAANGIMVTDETGRIVWANGAFTETTGYSQAEAVGQNARLLKSGEHGQAFYQEMWDTILSGKVWHDSLVNRRKDGKLYIEDLMITPIADVAGKFTRFVAIQHDMTERRRLKEAEKTSELRYRRLFESAKDGILILDAETGHIVDANPFIINTLGYSHEELIGKELWEIGFFQDVTEAKKAFEELQINGYVRYEDLPLKTRKGLVIEVEVVSNVYPVGESKVIQCNIRDITERRRGERELEASNRKLETTLGELSATTQQLWQASKLATMGELSASIAHELNNPLATVALRVENLLMPMGADDKKRHSLEVITQEVDRMAALVNNLLQFSRRSHRQVSTADVREEIAKSIEFVNYHLRTHKIEVVTDFAEPLPTIQADHLQLRQLFLNLLTNASDAMPQGGTLTVRATTGVLHEAEAVQIDFADTGEGISPENLKKIWDPFFTTKMEGKGTGLGLAICRRIVEEHGGTIDLESEPGSGTTVHIAFPATMDGPALQQIS